MMFTSKTGRSFYDEAIHGARQLSVIDPAYVWPMIDVELQPGESLTDIHGETHTNDTEAPITVSVPDPDAIPTVLLEPNPDTLIPLDAVEISVEDWQALLDGQSAGQMIDWGEDGYPFLTDQPPPEPLNAEETEAARLQAYANPLTGSDRHFAEAARCSTAGDTTGAQSATAAGQARYEQIRAELPWPETPPAARKAKK
jgi:hypothetical protein